MTMQAYLMETGTIWQTQIPFCYGFRGFTWGNKGDRRKSLRQKKHALTVIERFYVGKAQILS